jgi:hypothetical protein
MFWLGLVLPVCFVPGFTGATIRTQLVALTLFLLLVYGALRPLGRWGEPKITQEHWIGQAFWIYAAASIGWSISWTDSIEGLWTVSIWAGSFWLGSTLESLQDLWKGLAIGLTANVIVQIAQVAGMDPVLVRSGNAGLLYNPNLLAAAIALVVVGLVTVKAWWYVPALLPGLWLTHSRGGAVILAAGLAARYLNWATVPVLVAISGGIFLWHPDQSSAFRITIWQIAWQHLTWFGLGAGTFVDVLYMTPEQGWIHLEFAHNDYLQLAFEYGLGAALPLGLLVFCLTRTTSPSWPVMVGFAVSGLFYFPLYTELTAFIGCAVAGLIVRDWAVYVDYCGSCGFPVVPRLCGEGPDIDGAGGKTVPVGFHHPDAGKVTI